MFSYPLRRALLSAALVLIPLKAQDFVVTTVAGGALPNTPSQGTSVSVHYPRSLFVDASGSTYFALANAVLKLDKSGVLTRFAGSFAAGYAGDGGPATTARMYYPNGITADPGGNVFIADLGNAVVRKVSTNGIISTYAGSGIYGTAGDGGQAIQASLGGIASVALDHSGNLYLGDISFHNIRKVAPDGTISTLLNTGIAAPWGLACDHSDNLYIADANANIVFRLSPQGTLTNFAGTGTAGYPGDGAAATKAQLSNPNGVSTDNVGNVYITDTGNNVIRKVDTQGIITTVAGNVSNSYILLGDGLPATSAGLLFPQAAGVDKDGNLYISDLANNRIRKVTTDGIIHTAVGGGVAAAGDGGPATSAQINGPYGATLDNAGNLYVADSLNNKVRKVAPDGTISTFAGTGAQGSSGDGGPATQAQFHMPWGIAADTQGNVFIGDFYNPEVRKVDPSGKLSLYTGTQFVAGLTLDSAGNLYIAEYASGQIWKILPSGKGDIFAGVCCSNTNGTGPHYGGDGGPAMKASFNLPSGLTADSKGNLYIADSGNNRIRKLDSNGIVTTVAGNGTQGFGGDGGPATQAQLNSPSGVAVDASGNLYIADWNNARVRMVDTSGNISTIAGTYGYPGFGDGGLATNAVFGAPVGITIDAHGNLFVADQYDSVIRMLTPAGRTPVLAITNTHPGVTVAGQPISSSIVVANAASAGPTSGPITVSLTLPSALTLTGGGGTGWTCTNLTCTRSDALAPGAAYPPITAKTVLALTASGQVTSTASVTGGGSMYSASAQDVITVAAPGSNCTYMIDATGASLPSSGASGTVNMITTAGCFWSTSVDQSWVTVGGAGSGPGPIAYSVSANPGGTRTATITVGGMSFAISQAGSAVESLPLAGVLAHFASGSGWASTVTVVNTSAVPAEAAFNFYDKNGNPVPLPSTFPQNPALGTQQVVTWDQTLAANALSVLDTRQSGTGSEGSAQLRAPAGVSGFEVFANLGSGQQAAVPLETRSAPSYLLAFDNTGVLLTGLAIANVADATAQINVIIRDDTGAQLAIKNKRLDSFAHDSFMLATQWSETQGKRGTVEFDTPSGGRITALGLRANGAAFTTLPVMANVGTGGGSLAHFQSGGGWQTTFTLANSGTAAAPFSVTFYGDNGAPVALPITSPELGDLGTQNTVTGTLQPGASVQLVTNGTTGQTGSARLTSPGNVSGFAIFRSDAGQEAVVPLETRLGTFVLAFDNTSGLQTGLAIANFSAQAATVNAIVRDDTGAQIGTEIEHLDANGHDSFMLAGTWIETGGKRGTVEFVPPAGGSIGVIGIRAIPATGVVTTIPVLAK